MIAPIECLPEYLREFREIQIICDVIKQQADEAKDALESVWDNNFISTLTEDGCYRWEQILGLSHSGSLDVRRARIEVHTMDMRPYTVQQLERKMQSMVGSGNFKITVTPPDLANKKRGDLHIEYWAGAPGMDDVFNQLREMIPVDMNLTSSPFIHTNSDLRKYTHDQLSSYTNNELQISKGI